MLNSILLFGGLAGIVFLFMTLVQNKDGIGKYLKDMFQKKKIGEIADINKKEETVIKKIEDSEVLSEATKEKVKTIKREANKQIIEVLKTENFADLAKKEDELW
jgi:low affinity Fe/Cu permease